VDSAHDRLIDGALDLFASRGFAATSIRDLARAAELTSAALYHWYPTKDDLLVSIMDGGLRRLEAIATMALAEVEGPADRLATLVAVHVSTHVHTPREVKVIDTEVRSLSGAALAKVLARRDAYESLWTDALRAGSDAAMFDIAQPSLARLALLEMCNGVAHWFRPEGSLGEADVCRSFIDHALGMVHATIGGQAVRVGDVRWPSVGQLEVFRLAASSLAELQARAG
jgi:AcrR family transcriptional regulator